MNSWVHCRCLPEGVGRPPGKGFRSRIYAIDVIDLHQYPIGKRAAGRASDLISEQHGRAVHDSIVMRLNDALFVVIEDSDQTPVLDCHSNERIEVGVGRLKRRHPTSILPQVQNVGCRQPKRHESSTASTQPALPPLVLRAARAQPDTRTSLLDLVRRCESGS